MKNSRQSLMSLCLSNKILAFCSGKFKPLRFSPPGLRFKIENLRWNVSI
jgi:hypothetical protein